MRKCVILCVLLCLLTPPLWASPITRKEDISDFLKTTTYVVLDQNPMTEWNMKIRQAVESSWTITPYKFITDTEFEEIRNDIDKSFLVRMKVKYPKDKVKATYHFMVVAMGAAVKSVNDMPEVCSVPLGYDMVEPTSWTYKLASFVRFAQKHIRLLQENPKLISDSPFEQYNKNIPEIGDREIWVVESDLALETRALERIRDNYKGVVRVVKPDDIEKAILERNPAVIYLHKVGPEGTRLQARIYKVLIGAEDDRVYYFDYHIMTKKKGDGFLRKDFKRIGRR